jgi:uncharacterized membrane protein
VARVVASGLLALSLTAGLLIPLLPCAARHAPAFTAMVYAAGGLICHQREDRSFASCGASWPVCGRCSGLYLGAAAGALLAAFGVRWRSTPAWWRRVLPLAAAPTVISWAVEAATRLDPGTPLRFVAALPLGVAVALWLAEVARGHLR